MIKSVILACLWASTAMAFAPMIARRATTVARPMAEIFDQEQFNAEGKEMRLKHLEEQAMFALKIAVENYGAFICVLGCGCCDSFRINVMDTYRISLQGIVMTGSTVRHVSFQ
jgi:hypothetical protein